METTRERIEDLNARTADVHRRRTGTELDLEEYAEDRYAFDFALMPTRQWAQVDTTADAHYHGIWTCPGQRRILSYIEGDITDIRCDTDAEYLAELEKQHEFHVRQGSWKGIDAPYAAVAEHLRNIGAGHLLYA